MFLLKRRKDLNLCAYCGEPGHDFSSSLKDQLKKLLIQSKYRLSTSLIIEETQLFSLTLLFMLVVMGIITCSIFLHS